MVSKDGYRSFWILKPYLPMEKRSDWNDSIDLIDLQEPQRAHQSLSYHCGRNMVYSILRLPPRWKLFLNQQGSTIIFRSALQAERVPFRFAHRSVNESFTTGGLDTCFFLQNFQWHGADRAWYGVCRPKYFVISRSPVNCMGVTLNLCQRSFWQAHCYYKCRPKVASQMSTRIRLYI